MTLRAPTAVLGTWAFNECSLLLLSSVTESRLPLLWQTGTSRGGPSSRGKTTAGLSCLPCKMLPAYLSDFLFLGCRAQPQKEAKRKVDSFRTRKSSPAFPLTLRSPCQTVPKSCHRFFVIPLSYYVSSSSSLCGHQYRLPDFLQIFLTASCTWLPGSFFFSSFFNLLF